MNKYFFRYEDIEPSDLSWGNSRWLCAPDITKYKNMSACYVIVNPGEGHMTHTHAGSDEILFFLSGNGNQTVADETQFVSAGSFVYIPANTEHQTLNTGIDKLVFLAIYSPAVRT